MAKLAQPRMSRVLVGENRPGLLHRPLDPKGGIVPGEPVVMCCGVMRRYLIGDLGIGLEGAEAVSEADGHQKLQPVLAAQFDGDMAAEGRRRASEVDRDIKDAATADADELCLSEGSTLEVQASDGAGLGRQGEVILNELVNDAGRGKGFLVVGLRRSIRADRRMPWSG